MAKADRRVQRTRALLQQTLIELMRERDYDGITVQEVVDHANIGRTTFYQHYRDKDHLFFSCHEVIVSEFHLGTHYPLTREQLLATEAPAEMISAYQHLGEVRSRLQPIFQGRGNLMILRNMLRDRNAGAIEFNLLKVFDETESAIPFEVLANYLAGAHMALLQWWLEKRRPYTPENLAQAFHRLQRAAIRDAFGLAKDSA